MRVARLHQFGPAENLRYETAADPHPLAGQVRIEVNAAGVHLMETWLRQGKPVGPHSSPELPIVFGGEVAGVVDALGPDVPSEWLGRRVVASPAGGGYAELAVADLTDLHQIPDTMDYPAAVAMLTTGVTTLAILEIAQLTAEDTVVITAAAGGIGSLLVQAAKNTGATVVAAAGGHTKTAYVAGLGADIAADYRADDWADTVRRSLNGQPATVLLDGVGGAAANSAATLLAPESRIVSYGTASDSGDISDTGLRNLGHHFESLFESSVMKKLTNPVGSREFQAQALAAAATGELVPGIASFPLSDAAGAHRALENRRTIGKVVLEVDRTAQILV